MQPFAIDGSGGCLPSAPQRAGYCRLGKSFQKLLARVRQDFVAELGKKFSGRVVEISMRHSGIRFSLPSEKSLYVSAVLFQESPGAILRMALKVNEEAIFFPLHE